MKLRDIPEILCFLPPDINLDADINDPVIDGLTGVITGSQMLMPVLHWACAKKFDGLIRHLIANREQYGLDINARAPNNSNALRFTTTCSVMQILIEAGADLAVPGLFDPDGEPKHARSFLPLDRFLEEPSTYRTTQEYEPYFRHYNDFELTKGVLSAIYNQYFYKGMPEFIALLTEIMRSGATPTIVVEYAYDFEISSITQSLTECRLQNFVINCKAAYYECALNKRLQDLSKELGKEGIRKLTALAKPEQDTSPVVLHFSSSAKQTASATTRSSSSGSNPQKPKLEVHACKNRRPGT